MQPLLFDEGLPGGASVPIALRALGLTASAVGEQGAPPEGSSDDTNCKWCAAQGAVLLTHDKGKKDREILEVLDRHCVGSILIPTGLRRCRPHVLAASILKAESEMDAISAKRRLRHCLRQSGNLVKA